MKAKGLLQYNCSIQNILNVGHKKATNNHICGLWRHGLNHT